MERSFRRLQNYYTASLEFYPWVMLESAQTGVFFPSDPKTSLSSTLEIQLVLSLTTSSASGKEIYHSGII